MACLADDRMLWSLGRLREREEEKGGEGEGGGGGGKGRGQAHTCLTHTGLW